MHRFSKSGAIIGLTIFLLLINLFGSLPAFATSVPTSHRPRHSSGGGHAATIHQVSRHTVTMSHVPLATAKQLARVRQQRWPQAGFNTAQQKRLKAQARTNRNATRATHPQPFPHSTRSKVHALTPGTSTNFQGLTSSCGCQPPDMALAASPSWVFQGVNSSFAIYDTSGTLQQGPVLSRDFFGVPDPGACSSSGAFMSDPRAFYDPIDQRFWVAMLEVEGAGGINACPEKTNYWIGVSQTSDPRGGWNVYAFDMRAGINTTNFADYVKFGFNQTAVLFSADMFDQTGSAFQYEEIFGALKSTMEAGSSTSFNGFTSLFATNSRTVLVDNVQPVEAFDSTSGGLFISSYNGGEFSQFQGDPFGDDCITTACHGLMVWSLSNPGTSSTGLTVAAIDQTTSYILPPSATQQGSSSQVDTGDNRITGTPTYRNGLISFAHNTSVTASGGVNVSNVSGILWGQVAPVLDANGNLTSASLSQEGTFSYAGDSSAYYGTLMPNAAGNLSMAYEFSSDSFSPGDPGIAYVTRDSSTPQGSFSDSGSFLRQGDAATTDVRWGDYEAASYDGSIDQGGTDTVWFAGEYSPSNGDWSTYIGSINF